MQQRLDEFVRLAQHCQDPSASLSHRQLGQLKQSKSRKRKRFGGENVVSSVQSHVAVLTLNALASVLISTKRRLPVDSRLFVVDWRRGSVVRTRTFPDLLFAGDYFVGKLSAMGQPTRQTQPSIPPGSVNK